MKKYKLIKEYSNLPFGWRKGTIINTPFYKTKNETKKIDVRNNPEYWEEIEEKNYQILDVEYTEPQLIHSLKGKIKSVKRLSDGEVFTLGDRIDSYCESGCITEFEITENNIKVHFLDDKSTHQNEWTFLNNTIKPKPPLFTTEDGVDIFKGDKYWVVHLNCDTTVASKITADGKELVDLFKRFSTKEKAEEWIYNEPRYSKNDIKDAVDKSKIYKNVEYNSINLKRFWDVLDDAR